MAYCCSLTVCKVGLQRKRQFVEEFPPLVLQCQFKGGRKTLPYNMLCCTYWVKSSEFGVELFICFEKYIPIGIPNSTDESLLIYKNTLVGLVLEN